MTQRHGVCLRAPVHTGSTRDLARYTKVCKTCKSRSSGGGCSRRDERAAAPRRPVSRSLNTPVPRKYHRQNSQRLCPAATLLRACAVGDSPCTLAIPLIFSAGALVSISILISRHPLFESESQTVEVSRGRPLRADVSLLVFSDQHFLSFKIISRTRTCPGKAITGRTPDAPSTFAHIHGRGGCIRVVEVHVTCSRPISASRTS
jgi:hypothetical protein